MNNLWRGIILVIGSIFIFSVVIFRPEFLKSVRRSGSKYHLSRLGAASCGVALLAIGITGILNGLAMLSGVYVESVFVLAIIQLLAVGFYDTYRKSRLGSHPPFYVGSPKDESRNKKMMFFFLVTLPLVVVFASVIHFVFPTLDTVDLKFYAVLGIVLLAFVIFFVMGANDKNGKG